MAQAGFVQPGTGGIRRKGRRVSSGWRQTTAYCRRRWHRKSPWRLFRPARPPRRLAATGGKRLSRDAAPAARLSSSAGIRSVCRTHRQLMRMEKLLRENGVTVYEADVRPPDYLMERLLRRTFGWSGEMRNGVYPQCVLNLTPDYRPPLKWVSLDIETTRHVTNLPCYVVWKAAASVPFICWVRRMAVMTASWTSSLCMSPAARGCWKNSARFAGTI